MLWSAPHPFASSYRVEVSGWDSAQSFFVETVNLEWDEASSKNITLDRSLCPGTMVFVRLLLPTSTERSFPVPYQAEHIATTEEGHQRFRLKQVHPRSGADESSR